MRILILLTSLLAVSCGQIRESNSLKDKVGYIVDSLPETEILFDSLFMIVPRNVVEYVGENSDTINIIQTIPEFYSNYISQPNYPEERLKKQGLKVIVSTNQNISVDLDQDYIPRDNIVFTPPTLNDNENSISESQEIEKYSFEKSNRTSYLRQALPVLIINTTDETLYVEHQDLRLILIQEAKDENGIWKPIEYWRYSSCGNSYGLIKLYPENVAIIKVLKYSGDFETDIRLKLKNGDNIIYSNTFKGKINKNQFEIHNACRVSYLASRFNEEEYFDRIFLNK